MSRDCFFFNNDGRSSRSDSGSDTLINHLFPALRDHTSVRDHNDGSSGKERETFYGNNHPSLPALELVGAVALAIAEAASICLGSRGLYPLWRGLQSPTSSWPADYRPAFRQDSRGYDRPTDRTTPVPEFNPPEEFRPFQSSISPLTPMSPMTQSSDLERLFDKAAEGKTDRANKVHRLPNGSIYLKSDFDVDADGSPNARRLDPKYGQLETSLRHSNGESVDAENIPYFVLPLGEYKSIAKLGDVAVVKNPVNGKTAAAVFADVGPRGKYGEGSIALAEALGLNSSPVNGGEDRPIIEYLIFPGSGDGTPGTVEGNHERAIKILQAVTGESQTERV